jgi:hypothetical protein
MGSAPMQHVFRIWFALFLLLSDHQPTAAAGASYFDHSINNEMVFLIGSTGGNCNTCSWIVAEGKITKSTPQDFANFLEKQSSLGWLPGDIHLNSPGGDLIAGIKFGEMIRQKQLNTWVAKTVGPLEDPAGKREYVDAYRNDEAPEGLCASSCAYAFIGGYRRYAASNHYQNGISVRNIGRIAVHQFYADLPVNDANKAAFSAIDRSLDQITTGLLLEYVLRMGVKPEFVAIASKTPPWQEIHFLSDEELRSIGVENAEKAVVLGVEVLGSNGAAVFARFELADAKVTARLFCKGDRLIMWVTQEGKNSTSLGAIEEWSLYDNWSIKTMRSTVSLAKTKLDVSADGHVVDVVFQFGTTPIKELVDVKDFVFEANTSRYAAEAAAEFSFKLPAEFRGLNLLPRVCLK